MISKLLLGGALFLFVNSCMIPIYFVGFQFRTLKGFEEKNIHQQVLGLSAGNFKHYVSNNCNYYYNKNSARYFAVCKKADLFYIGTDIRAEQASLLADIEKVKANDLELKERIQNIEKVVAALKPSIENHTYTVYKSFELERF